MKKRSMFPFRLFPGSWGLRGKTYDRAEAEYRYTGEDLERRLLEIEIDDPVVLADKMLDIDLKFHHKTEYDVDCIREKAFDDLTGLKVIELKIKHKLGEPYSLHKTLAELKNQNEEDRKLALLDVDRAYDKITDCEYEKQRAIVRNEPWVGIVDHGFNPGDGVNGLYIEFDWNDAWIAFLRQNGYQGASEDEIVEHWFQDLNQDVAKDVEFGYNFIQDAPRKGNRIDRGNGTSDHF